MIILDHETLAKALVRDDGTIDVNVLLRNRGVSCANFREFARVFL